MRSSVAAAGLALALVVAGCSGADDGAVSTGDASSGSVATGAASAEPSDDTASPEDTADDGESASPDDAEDTEDTAKGPVVTTAGSHVGTVLFDGRRQAIYLFDKEAGRTPRCYGACAAAWPPVLADGDPRARRQVRDGLLGTVERRDGSRQVTYAGHPLYFYAHEGPGQLLCHDIVEYGGRWLAVTPRGVAAPT